MCALGKNICIYIYIYILYVCIVSDIKIEPFRGSFFMVNISINHEHDRFYLYVGDYRCVATREIT